MRGLRRSGASRELFIGSSRRRRLRPLAARAAPTGGLRCGGCVGAAPAASFSSAHPGAVAFDPSRLAPLLREGGGAGGCVGAAPAASFSSAHPGVVAFDPSRLAPLLREGGGAGGCVGAAPAASFSSAHPGVVALDPSRLAPLLREGCGAGGCVGAAPAASFSSAHPGAVAFDPSRLAPLLREGGGQPCILPMVWRRRVWARVKKKPPMSATIRNCGHTTSSPAPRKSTPWARLT
ncbi:hypothetical protein TMEC50S_03751 [Thauera mechernichensis]